MKKPEAMTAEELQAKIDSVSDTVCRLAGSGSGFHLELMIQDEGKLRDLFRVRFGRWPK